MSDGTNQIKEQLRAYSRKGHLAGLSRDIGVSTQTLEAFVDGTAQLPADKLVAMVAWLWGGHVEYVVDGDRLRSTNKAEPQPLGVRPPELDIDALPTFDPTNIRVGPQPLDDETKPKRRLGFSGWSW